MSDRRPNVVLGGFMGTGKTAVARLVAARLGRPLVDMDAEIARRAGKEIPRIFAEDGEEDFRTLERALCAELGAREGLVIATGGGALVDEENRACLGAAGGASAAGIVICLACAEEELMSRLRGDEGRPMLWGPDPAARLRALLADRAPAYAQVPYQIDTTGRTPDEVAEAVLALVARAPETLTVRTPLGTYPVHLIAGGLDLLGEILAGRGIRAGVAVVSDANVWSLYGAQVEASLAARVGKVVSIVQPAGEEHKTLSDLYTVYDRLAAAGLDRGGAIVGLGGGVITDLAGLAAATYLRGVRYVPVSTTLLGMVDAAVGGKVAVDHPRGKNLIGAFVQPLCVLADSRALATLPEVERRAGLAEIIKAGVIGDPELFAALETGANLLSDDRTTSQLVARALRVKIAVVEEDPYEEGRRATLNLGHTFAHAYEVLSGYRLHHGLAVAIGTVAATHLAARRGLCDVETRRRIEATLERHGLPVRYAEHPPADVYAAMGTDKKRRSGRLRFVLPRAIGDVAIEDGVTESEVLATLEELRQ